MMMDSFQPARPSIRKRNLASLHLIHPHPVFASYPDSPKGCLTLAVEGYCTGDAVKLYQHIELHGETGLMVFCMHSCLQDDPCEQQYGAANLVVLLSSVYGGRSTRHHRMVICCIGDSHRQELPQPGRRLHHLASENTLMTSL